MSELTLKHIPTEYRTPGEAFISHDIHGSAMFIDCEIWNPVTWKGFIWCIGFNSSKSDIVYYNAGMGEISCEEFIELVTAKTPQYLTALLFLIPSPALYIEMLTQATYFEEL